MSTVLKAVQEIERRAAPLASNASPTGPTDDRRPHVWWMALVGIVVVAASALVVVRSLRAPRHMTPSTDPRLPEAVVLASQPSVAAPSVPVPVPAPDLEEAPWGALTTARSSAPSDLARGAPTAARPPRQVAVERKPKVALAPKPRTEDRDEPIGSTDDDTAPASSSNLPRVEVRSIVYASESTGRTVTLRVGGASAVTLHEGESVHGVDVQLIMPGSVYLRHAGSIFAVSTDR